MFSKRTLKETSKKIFLLVLSLALLSGLALDRSSWNNENSISEKAYAENTTSSDYFEQWIRVNNLWFGIHSDSSVFDANSKFHVEILNKETDGYTAKLDMLDREIKEKVEADNLLLFNMGVTKPDGTEYSKLNGKADVYIEQPSGWDYKEMQAVLVSQFQDAQFTESFVQINPVNDDTQFNTDDSSEIQINPDNDGNHNFIKITVDHFSPYAVYDELTIWDYAENYSWIAGILVLAIGACIIIYLKVRKKQPIA